MNKFINLTPNIMVDDVEATILFYEQTLGFQVIDRVDVEGSCVWAMVGKDTVILMIQLKASLVDEYPILETAKITPSLSLFFKVEDVTKLADTLKAKGVSLYVELHMAPYNQLEFAILDNNNNVLTLSE